MSTLNKSTSTVGEQLRALRERKNLPLREVASSLGIDTSLLGKIERNERLATRGQIHQIASYYEVDEKRLMKEFLSDQFAYMIIEEEADLDTLKVAEKKVGYLKANNYGK